MAATGWSYLIEFHGDADVLLASLHRRVFDSGEYEIPWIEPELLDEVGFFEVSDEQRVQMAAQYDLEPLLAVASRVGLTNTLRWCNERIENQDVETLDDLRALQCISSSGTHSPLDIIGISQTPADLKLFPLTSEQVEGVFGKRRVQIGDISEGDMCIMNEAPDAYERRQAVYVPVYTGDELTHAYVEGVSGD